MADGGVRDAEVFKAGASEKKDEGIYNGPGTCVKKNLFVKESPPILNFP